MKIQVSKETKEFFRPIHIVQGIWALCFCYSVYYFVFGMIGRVFGGSYWYPNLNDNFFIAFIFTGLFTIAPYVEMGIKDIIREFRSRYKNGVLTI